MGFTDITDKHLPGPGRDSLVPLSQKFSLSLQDQDTQLPLYLMRMDRKGLSGLDIKINDPEIRRIMEPELLYISLKDPCFFKINDLQGQTSFVVESVSSG